MRSAPLRRSRLAAFTLIELMVVVAIVGILAVLAVYGVRKYLASAKTAEARNALGMISRDAIAEYEKDSMSAGQLAQGVSTPIMRSMCGSTTKSVPASASSIKGMKYQSSPADWNVDAPSNKGFACLHYTMDAPQYYLYDYKVAGAGGAENDTFTATANGDLNGDGRLSTFSIEGRINSGQLHVAPALGEIDVDE